jgi:hypothetical protein
MATQDPGLLDTAIIISWSSRTSCEKENRAWQMRVLVLPSRKRRNIHTIPSESAPYSGKWQHRSIWYPDESGFFWDQEMRRSLDMPNHVEDSRCDSGRRKDGRPGPGSWIEVDPRSPRPSYPCIIRGINDSSASVAACHMVSMRASPLRAMCQGGKWFLVA